MPLSNFLGPEFIFLIKRPKNIGSVEMAQQLRTSIVLVEDPSSVLSTGMELTTNYKL